MSFEAFKRIQISNAEGTPGTAEAATEAALGIITTQESGEVIHQPNDDRNTLAANMADDEIVGKETKLVWSGDVNSRHILWALLMSLRGNITPTQPDVTNEPLAYLFTITPALTTANTPDIANGIDTFTIEYGDNTQAYETECCFSTRLQISGAPNEVCKFTCDITGRQRTETTFTGALSVQSVQRFPFNKAAVYIDASGGTIGTTQKTNLLRAFQWTLETKFKAFYASDGELYFSSVVEDKKKPVLTLTYKRGTDSETERDKYDDRSTRLLRLKLNAQTEIDSGQSNPPYLILDQAIRYFKWPTPSSQDGARVVQVTAEGVWSDQSVLPEGTSTNSVQRSGDADHDDRTDWAFRSSPSLGQQNDELVLPFSGRGAASIGFELNPPGLEEAVLVNIENFYSRRIR